VPDYSPVPIRRDATLPLFAAARLARAQQRAEVQIQQHAVQAWRDSQMAALDAHALTSAVTAATEEELSFVDYGMTLVGTSAVKQELLARKLELLSTLNNAALRRRFGS
jgi:hypothetical protein